LPHGTFLWPEPVEEHNGLTKLEFHQTFLIILVNEVANTHETGVHRRKATDQHNSLQSNKTHAPCTEESVQATSVRTPKNPWL
jgi:hypothetical protein